ARAGDTDPVAGFTEIVREWRDKSQPTTGFLHTNIPRRPPGAVVDVLKRITIGQPCSHDGEWQVLIKTRFIDIAERHDLDHGKIHAASMTPFEGGGRVFFVYHLEFHAG